MSRGIYFFAGAIGGAVGGFFAGKYKKESFPYVIDVPSESDGKPIAIFKFPDQKLLDETRYPKEDKTTPMNAKQGIRTEQAKIGEGVNGWRSDIPPEAYLKLHRHPVPRVLYSRSEGVLYRHQEGNKSDKLNLEKNTLFLFAPDPKNQFHNDHNPSNEKGIDVIVIEFTPVKKK